MDDPSMVEGGVIPAKSMKVGPKSMFSTISCESQDILHMISATLVNLNNRQERPCK